MGAGSNNAHLNIIDEYRLMFTDNAPARHLKAYPDLLRRTCRKHGIPADKLRLIQLDAKIQPCLQWRNHIIHLMAIKRHGSLQPQGITGTQAARNEAVLPTCLHEDFPQLGTVFCCRINLIAQLAGIAGTGNHALQILDIDFLDSGVIFPGNGLLRQKLRHNLRRLRPLQGQLGNAVRNILNSSSIQHMLLHMCHILVPVGGIDHHQVLFLPKLVHNQVIHAAAIFMAHDAVADTPHSHIGKIIGQHVIEACQCRRPGEHHLAHVGNIKQAALLTDSHVLGNYA